jgi:hypothetical protein
VGEPDPITIESLSEEIISLCGVVHRAEYRLLALIRRLDARDPRNDAMPSCAHWQNYHCGIDLVTAREKVRIAHALPDLPAVTEAFADGRISYSKVRAITRIATPENEHELLALAQSTTAAHVEQFVRAQRQAVRLANIETPYASYRQRTFNGYVDDDGSVVFEGRLPADKGATLLLALERAADWLFRGEAADGGGERASAARDDAPRRSAAVRRADALAALAEHFLSNAPGAEASFNTADRFQLMIHASAESLLEQAAIDPGDPPQFEDGPVIAPEMARRFACDCAVVRLLENGAGEPLDIGRKTRVISAALRRALMRRDRGCRFPGCTRRRFVDAHHIEHWAEGGETKLGNLMLVCRHHHVLLHEGGCYVVKQDDELSFFHRDGTPIPPVDDWLYPARPYRRRTMIGEPMRAWRVERAARAPIGEFVSGAGPPARLR